MIRLTGYDQNKETLTYEITHSTPGREGTVLTADLHLRRYGDNQFECKISIDKCEGTTPKEVFDRMATWLRRLADGIDNRKDNILPM